MAETALTKHGTAPVARAHQNPVFTPRVDVRETETAVILVADMPGVDETSVTIGLDGSELAIRGAVAPEAPDGSALTYQEYGTGDYVRTFTLGDTIDRNGIEAVVKDGVLRLTLPKVRDAQPRRIAVATG